MKPSVEQEARLTPLLWMQYAAVTSECRHKQMLGLFFFFRFALLWFILPFTTAIHFLRQRKKRKALGRIQVFISAEGISIAFVKLSWSVKRLCLWLTVAESESINQNASRRERFLLNESSRIWCMGPVLKRVLFLAAWWKFTLIQLLCVRQQAQLNNGACQLTWLC